MELANSIAKLDLYRAGAPARLQGKYTIQID